MAKKSSSSKKTTPTLGECVLVTTRSAAPQCALLAPEIVTIEGLKFISGTQVTGKEGHRLEKKRTLIPIDHVAGIVQFDSEIDLWSEPQPKHLRLPGEETPSAQLTSHEPQREHRHRGHRPHRRGARHNGPQGEHPFNRRDFNRDGNFNR